MLFQACLLELISTQLSYRQEEDRDRHHAACQQAVSHQKHIELQVSMLRRCYADGWRTQTALRAAVATLQGSNPGHRTHVLASCILVVRSLSRLDCLFGSFTPSSFWKPVRRSVNSLFSLVSCSYSLAAPAGAAALLATIADLPVTRPGQTSRATLVSYT